jgi:hypothetical protein
VVSVIKAVIALGSALALITGCSTSKPQETVTVTVTPSRSPAGPSTSVTGSTTASGTASPAGASDSSAATLTKLPGTCDDLLSDYSVSQALGGKQLGGKDGFVVGVPEKDIGRIAYLNCRYGVTGSGTAAKRKMEVGLSLYSSPAKASARIQATVTDYDSHGATATAVSVDNRPAQLLTGGVGSGYDEPLLVVASGQRTVAVTISPTFATGTAAAKDASAVAEVALKHTGG